MESDGAAKYFCQIACPNCQLAHEPIRPTGPGGIPVAAALREIFSSHYPQSGGDHLHENGHDAGQTDDPQQTVFELSTALQIRPPVAWIHIANAHENRGAYE